MVVVPVCAGCRASPLPLTPAVPASSLIGHAAGALESTGPRRPRSALAGSVGDGVDIAVSAGGGSIEADAMPPGPVPSARSVPGNGVLKAPVITPPTASKPTANAPGVQLFSLLTGSNCLGRYGSWDRWPGCCRVPFCGAGRRLARRRLRGFAVPGTGPARRLRGLAVPGRGPARRCVRLRVLPRHGPARCVRLPAVPARRPRLPECHRDTWLSHESTLCHAQPPSRSSPAHQFPQWADQMATLVVCCTLVHAIVIASRPPTLSVITVSANTFRCTDRGNTS
jgi:hypothetical protein